MLNISDLPFPTSAVIQVPIVIIVGLLTVVAMLCSLCGKEWRKTAVSWLLFAVILGGMLAAFLVPMLSGPAMPPRITATNNLKQIGLAILMYADDNEDHLPPTLGATFPYVNDGSVYVVPGSGTPNPENEADVDSGQCDFLYFGEGKIDWESEGGSVLVTTTFGVLGSKKEVCVLYLDGHVEAHNSVPELVKALWEAHPNGKPPPATPSDRPVRSD